MVIQESDPKSKDNSEKYAREIGAKTPQQNSEAVINKTFPTPKTTTPLGYHTRKKQGQMGKQ